MTEAVHEVKKTQTHPGTRISGSNRPGSSERGGTSTDEEVGGVWGDLGGGGFGVDTWSLHESATAESEDEREREKEQKREMQKAKAGEGDSQCMILDAHQHPWLTQIHLSKWKKNKMFRVGEINYYHYQEPRNNVTSREKSCNEKEC